MRWAAPQRTTAALSGLLLAMVACDAELTEVQLGELDFAFAFAILLNEDGAPVRVGPVFGRYAGDSFGRNAIEIEDGESQALLVTITQEKLTEAVFDFDVSRAPQLAVALESPPPAPRFVDAPNDEPTRQVSLPQQADYYLAAIDGQRRALGALRAIDEPSDVVRGAVSVFVPVNPEICRRPGQSPLVPFAADAQPFDPSRTDAVSSKQMNDLVWLDADRLLVVATNRLYVVRRGLVWSDTPSTHYRLPSDPRFARLRFEESAAEPPQPDGTRVVWVSGGFEGDFDDAKIRRLGAHGILWKATFDTDGLQTVQTATETPGHQLWTVEVADDGAVLVGGDGGLVLRKGPEDGGFRRWRAVVPREAEVGADWISSLASLPRSSIEGGSSVRWFATTLSVIHEFEAVRDAWVPRTVFRDILSSPEPFKFFALDARARGADDVELWAAGSRGGLVRRAGLSASWAQVEPSFPPRFEPCASASDGAGLQVLKAINDLVIHDGYVHLAIENCTAVAMIRLSPISEPADPSGCVSLLTEGVATPNFTPAEYTAFAVRPGEVAVLRGDGRLLSSTWAP